MILKKNRTIILTTAALIPVMVALGGCSWLQENPKSGTYNNWQAAETVAPPPQTRVMQTAEGTWLEPDRTPKPVPTATELAELKQANLRIAELEQEIGALRNDMNMMMPALTRLAGLERNASVALNDIQPAAGGVQGGEVPRIHRNYIQATELAADNPEIEMDQPVYAAPQTAPVPAPAPVPLTPTARVQPAPVPVPAPPAAVQPMVQPAAPVAQPAAYTPPAINVAAVQGVRLGNHETGKTRMVFDVSKASTFTYDVDNAEKILVIEIPSTVWNAGPVTRNFMENPLVKSLAASPNGQGGTRIVVQLSAPAKVLWSQAIPPAGLQGDRIVFDLAGA